MRCTLCFAVFSVVTLAQPPVNATTPDGQTNGRFWQFLGDSRSRQLYLAGYFDGFDQALVSMLDGKNSKQVDLVGSESIPKANVGETATILDKFYLVSENLNIPIWRALRVAVLQIAGRPKREIDAEMETARSVIRLYMQRCEKEKIGCEHLR